jgi:putative phosphoribosyl transferase
MLFADRNDAGRELADEIVRLCPPGAGGPPALVLALPRGGVPVAVPVAAALGADLDVVVARKIAASPRSLPCAGCGCAPRPG